MITALLVVVVVVFYENIHRYDATIGRSLVVKSSQQMTDRDVTIDKQTKTKQQRLNNKAIMLADSQISNININVC